MSLLFYRSWVAFFLFLPGFYWFWKEKKETLAARRRGKLEQGFLLGMQYTAAALSAGYSVEHAFRQALSELKKVCREKEPVLREFARISAGLGINRTLEELLLDLAHRSQVEDIRTFAEVFASARRSGGDLIAIIRNTTSSISAREEIRQEIEVCLAAKKMEQNIMSMVPGLIICYVSISSPGFLDVMYGNAAGILVMSLCLGIYIFAFMLGRKFVNIEI